MPGYPAAPMVGNRAYRKSGSTGSSVWDILRMISGEDSGLTRFANWADPGPDSASNVGSGAGKVMGTVARSALADRTAVQSPSTDHQGIGRSVTPFEALIKAAMSGGSSGGRGQMRAALAPANAAIAALQQQLGQVGMQTDQNIADINSWFGQLSGDYRKNARVATRTAKRTAKGTKKLTKGILSGVADANVARSAAAGGVRDVRETMRMGQVESNFARSQAMDAQRQASYERLVQQRLGAQAQTDIRSQIAQAQAAKQSAKYEFKSQQDDRLGGIMDIIQLLPEDARLAYLQTGKLPKGVEESGYGLEEGSALNSALNSVKLFQDDSQGGAPTANLEGMLQMLYARASARGLDINDPQVREAVKNYMASQLPQYNAAGGAQYAYVNGGFRNVK